MDLLTHMVKLFQCRKFKSNVNLNKPSEPDKHGFFFFFVEMYSVQTLTAKATCTLMCMLVIFISFYCGNESCVQISRASFWMCFEDLLWTSTLNGLIICLQYPQSICFWIQMPLNLHIKTNIQWIQYS